MLRMFLNIVLACLLSAAPLGLQACTEGGGNEQTPGGGNDDGKDDGKDDGNDDGNDDGKEPEIPKVEDVRDLKSYTLAWSDEFEGDVLDTRVWNVEVNGNGGGNRELQFYRAENVAVGPEPESGEGCLILTARREDYNGRKATSGRINSKGKYSFLYGRIDARIKAPHTANGLWPAFWMMGEQYGWPKSGEIDIMEMGEATGIRNGVQDRYYNGACHWGESSASNHPAHAQHNTADRTLQGVFTLWTMVWEENKISMYLDLDKYPDAEPYFSMNIFKTETLNAAGRYFHQPNYILFNLAVGGNFPQIWDIEGITALAEGPASMYVDYVRVYRFKDSE